MRVSSAIALVVLLAVIGQIPSGDAASRGLLVHKLHKQEQEAPRRELASVVPIASPSVVLSTLGSPLYHLTFDVLGQTVVALLDTVYDLIVVPGEECLTGDCSGLLSKLDITDGTLVSCGSDVCKLAGLLTPTTCTTDNTCNIKYINSLGPVGNLLEAVVVTVDLVLVGVGITLANALVGVGLIADSLLGPGGLLNVLNGRKLSGLDGIPAIVGLNSAPTSLYSQLVSAGKIGKELSHCLDTTGGLVAFGESLVSVPDIAIEVSVPLVTVSGLFNDYITVKGISLLVSTTEPAPEPTPAPKGKGKSPGPKPGKSGEAPGHNKPMPGKKLAVPPLPLFSVAAPLLLSSTTPTIVLEANVLNLILAALTVNLKTISLVDPTSIALATVDADVQLLQFSTHSPIALVDLDIILPILQIHLDVAVGGLPILIKPSSYLLPTCGLTGTCTTFSVLLQAAVAPLIPTLGLPFLLNNVIQLQRGAGLVKIFNGLTTCAQVVFNAV